MTAPAPPSPPPAPRKPSWWAAGAGPVAAWACGKVVDKVLSAGWTALLEAWVPMVVVVAAVVVLFSMRARLQAAFACSAPIARKAFVGIGVLALVLGGAMVVGCTLQGRAGKTVDPDAVSLGIWNLVTGACWLLLVFPRERPAPEPGVGAA